MKTKRTKAVWLPIETAPMDGTPVIVVEAGSCRSPTTARYEVYHPNAKGARCWRTDLAGYRIAPTHWLPIKLPTAKDLRL